MAREELLFRKMFTYGLQWLEGDDHEMLFGQSYASSTPPNRTPWEEWKKNNANVSANLRGVFADGVSLSEVDLSLANLEGSNFSRANLSAANLSATCLRRSALRGANLDRARFVGSDLSDADLTGASIDGADFTSAILSGANLTGAHGTDACFTNAELRGSNLSRVLLIRPKFTEANLSDCSIYGMSVWDAQLDRAIQKNLTIRPDRGSQPMITVDNIEVAQFIYLLVNNQKIRQFVDTITSKLVLILGRFTEERKTILDAIRDELRKRDYLPVLFDFEAPCNRDLTETVSMLAHMARFVIADITDAKSIPQELMRIVPALPSVPVQPLLLASQKEYGMFEHFRHFPWVLEPFLYDDHDGLLAALTERVIGPVEARASERARQ